MSVDTRPVFAYGKRIGKPLAGAAAALLVYLSPIVGLDGTIAYTDVATAAIVFSVFYWTQLWDEALPLAVSIRPQQGNRVRTALR